MFWTFVGATPAMGGSVQIDGKRGHHLARVLRVRPGERGIAVFAGHEYELEVVAVGGAGIQGPLLGAPPPPRGAATAGPPPSGLLAQPPPPPPLGGGAPRCAPPLFVVH